MTAPREICVADALPPPTAAADADADASWLLRWAYAVHRFEKRAAHEEDAASPLDVFVLSPARKALGTSLRFMLTTLAIFVAPQALHANPRRADNPFLPYRSFVIAAIALYDVLGGQLVRVQSIEAMADPTLKSITKSALNAGALLYFTAALALSFWAAATLARWVGTVVDPRQSGVEGGADTGRPQAVSFPATSAVRIACYAMGAGPPLRLSMFVYGPLFQAVLASALPFGAKVGIFVVLIGAFGLYFVQVTFVTPVKVIAPGASAPALWAAYIVSVVLMFIALQVLAASMDAAFPGESYRIGL